MQNLNRRPMGDDRKDKFNARRVLPVIGVVALAAGGIVVGRYVLWQVLGIPTVSLPTLKDMERGVAIFDAQDKYVQTIYPEKDRKPVPLDRISKNVVKALLAVEDRDFFQHGGVNPASIIRAFLENYKAGHVVQGGSTITQQLVGNLYLDRHDRSYTRKIKEAVLAWEVENHYSKRQILETYLNDVYFGKGVHGIERAAQRYFNKSALKLTVPESAFLIGMLKAPGSLSAPQNLNAALERQQLVLRMMGENGYISRPEMSAALSAKLAFRKGPPRVKYPAYSDYVMRALRAEVGDDLWKQGWRVYTNLDVEAQKIAESTMARAFKKTPKGINQGALVSMKVNDGAVIAMVGGVGDLEKNQFNRALSPHTAGSAFKPFVYLAGIIHGVLNSETMVNDAPVSLNFSKHSPVYQPKNFDGRFMGWMPVRKALALSRNVCAVRVASATGLENIIRVARAAGVKARMDPYPSLALGACALSPLEMTTAYATLARTGVYTSAQVIRRIEHEDGREFRQFRPGAKDVLPRDAVAQLVDVMQDVVRAGTATKAKLPGIAVAGKTGTSDQAKDIWFIGFTPEIVTSVWGGNDTNMAVRGRHVTGGNIMAGIWREYMTGFHKLHPPVRKMFDLPGARLAERIPNLIDKMYQARNPQELAKYINREDAQRAALNSTEELRRMNERGVAEAYDLQKAEADRRVWASMAAMPEKSEEDEEDGRVEEEVPTAPKVLDYAVTVPRSAPEHATISPPPKPAPAPVEIERRRSGVKEYSITIDRSMGDSSHHDAVSSPHGAEPTYREPAPQARPAPSRVAPRIEVVRPERIEDEYDPTMDGTHLE